MNMNDKRRNTIALLLSRYPEDAEAEREQAILDNYNESLPPKKSEDLETVFRRTLYF